LTDNAAEDDSVSGEEGYVVDVPAVDASTLSCLAMSDGEEAGVGDEVILVDCEVAAADKVTAVDEAEAMVLRQAPPPSLRPALVRWRRPLLLGPRPKKCAVQGNKYTCLLNVVPV
jgi:hypothetical protein